MVTGRGGRKACSKMGRMIGKEEEEKDQDRMTRRKGGKKKKLE